MKIYFQLKRSLLSHRSLLYVFLVLTIGVILSTIVSFVVGNPWLVPLFGTLVAYPLYIFQVLQSQYKSAFVWVMIWAILQSIAIGIATTLMPEKAAEIILKGAGYTEEMFHWIRTGEGAEGSLALFLPDHLKQYGIFCVLSFMTLGSAALFFGTFQLNYMNFYVAELARQSTNPFLAVCLAWYPWSILRTIGFICTGITLTVLGLNLLNRIRGNKSQQNFPRLYLWMGIGFVIADIIVKASLAPIWRNFLVLILR
ncbi:MAG: hypothetical protein AB4290_02855 [Spirulina sp.]